MKSIRLKNYRCFKDTGKIELKPVNLLVGANSSGNSSLLKFFPLLKQSMRIRLNGVFRWLGNDVDFKDFKNVVFNGENEIEFEYTIERLPLLMGSRPNRMFLQNLIVQFTIIAKDDHFDRMTKLSLKYGNSNIDIIYDNNKNVEVIVNGESTKQTKSLEIESQRVDATIERLYFKYKENTYSLTPSIYLEQIYNILKNTEGNLNKKRHHRIFDFFPFDYNNFKKGIIGINKKDIDESIIQTLFNKSIICNINVLIDSINIYLIRYAENIVYIKPLRATIERYYRFQNLDLNEIDSDGTNLPMYLYNLPTLVIDELRKWLKQVFDLDLKINPLEGHIELLLSENSKEFRNPVDLGFGYTQLLPILVIVWKTIFLDSNKSSNKNKIFPGYVILIEQPELHLHPRFQRKFALMLAAMIGLCKKININVKFLVETHSETILNSLGDNVEKQLISPNDINVLLFEQNKEGISKITSTSYSYEGYLENWPLNFLEDVD